MQNTRISIRDHSKKNSKHILVRRLSRKEFDTESPKRGSSQDDLYQLSQGKIIRTKITSSEFSSGFYSSSDDQEDSSIFMSSSYDNSSEQTKPKFVPRRRRKQKKRIPKVLTETYKKFNLFMNKAARYYSKSPIHSLLPFPLKNDEKYKKKLLSYICYPKFKRNKTDACKFASYQKGEDKYDSLYDSFKTMKKARVSSVKSKYSSNNYFYNYKLVKGNTENTSMSWFKFFYDEDIGFDSNWQQQLREAEMDDDVESDEEVLYHSEKKVQRELIEGIEAFVNNKNSCRNYTKYHLNKYDN